MHSSFNIPIHIGFSISSHLSFYQTLLHFYSRHFSIWRRPDIISLRSSQEFLSLCIIVFKSNVLYFRTLMQRNLHVMLYPSYPVSWLPYGLWFLQYSNIYMHWIWPSVLWIIDKLVTCYLLLYLYQIAKRNWSQWTVK